MATPEEMTQTMIDNLPEKTGKSLQQWIDILTPLQLEKHGQLVKLLKTEHSVTHGFANLIANKTLATKVEQSDPVDLITSQYAGAKASLKPIFDKLLSQLQQSCGDIDIAPKKAYVSLRHKKQFALIQPSTKTRLDVGINLKGVAPQGILEASGSFNSMVSHRVRLTNTEQINLELIEWLKQAYTQAGS
jgi:predicted transport protein